MKTQDLLDACEAAARAGDYEFVSQVAGAIADGAAQRRQDIEAKMGDEVYYDAVEAACKADPTINYCDQLYKLAGKIKEE